MNCSRVGENLAFHRPDRSIKYPGSVLRFEAANRHGDQNLLKRSLKKFNFSISIQSEIAGDVLGYL
jgi:hypothetical protein